MTVLAVWNILGLAGIIFFLFALVCIVDKELRVKKGDSWVDHVVDHIADRALSVGRDRLSFGMKFVYYPFFSSLVVGAGLIAVIAYTFLASL